MVTTFGQVSLDKRHPWAAPDNGISISPLLQRNYLHHLAEVVPARAAKLLNSVLGQRLCSATQAQRLLDLYGSSPAVTTALERPQTGEEQSPLPLRQLDAAATKNDGQSPVVYGMFDGLMLPCDEGYEETKIGRVFSDDQIYSLTKGTDKEQLSTRRRVANSDYIAQRGHYEAFTERLTRLVQAKVKQVEETYSQIQAPIRPVFITDGARWMADYISREFAGCVHIVDFFHAFEHICDYGKVAYPQADNRQAYLEQKKAELRNGEVAKIIDELAPRCDESGSLVAKAAYSLHTYLTNNATRMRYDNYRAQGYLIGSGAIESAARSVVQQRCKLSGQRWNEGLQPVLNIRCLYESGKAKRMDKIILDHYRKRA